MDRQVSERILSLDKIVVNSRFGVRKDPFTGKKRKHNGLDLQVRNEKVYAMMVGEVIKVSSDKSSGKYVTIRHGGYTVSYCHLSEVWVKKGMKVMPERLLRSVGTVEEVPGRTCIYPSDSTSNISTLTYCSALYMKLGKRHGKD